MQQVISEYSSTHGALAPLTHLPADIGAPAAPEQDVPLWRRIVVGVAALWLFLCALSVMKLGAQALAPTLAGSTLTDSLASSVGFGWLAAMLVMSGSPIAVSALALLDGGVLSPVEAFGMLTGSRLGASFVVLVVAVLYAMRGRGAGVDRRASLSIGFYALILTAVVYVPGMLIGVPLLKSGRLDHLPLAPPPLLADGVKMITSPVVNSIEAILPNVTLFFAGLAILLVSLRLIDHVVPSARADAAEIDENTGWRSRRWVMFGLGSTVAFVTMSVSVALTVLVPLVAKGHLRRRHAIPYIMGANITTLGDTLVTAFVIGNVDGVHVVVAELVGITAITMVLLTVGWKPLVKTLERVTDWFLDGRLRTIGFMAALLLIPAALILLLP